MKSDTNFIEIGGLQVCGLHMSLINIVVHVEMNF